VAGKGRKREREKEKEQMNLFHLFTIRLLACAFLIPFLPFFVYDDIV